VVRPRISREQLAERRARRRRVTRRRRAVALGLALGCAAVASAAIVVDSAPGEPASAGEAAASPRPSTGRAPRRTPAAQSRLGSGRPVTFAFAGDVHFESPIRERLASSANGLLASIAPVLRRADLAMANLETAITTGGARAAKEFTFRAPASGLEALQASGIDVVNLANNHGMDFGPAGLRDTLAAARDAGLPLVGAGLDERRAYAPLRRTVNGQRIAIVGATQVLDDTLIDAWTARPGKPGLASAKRVDRLVRAVREARRTSDTVVVFLHWGVELVTCPTGDQKRLAQRLVAAGADVVVGSHAHVLLGAGRMEKALVAYGLGNFVFYAFREITSRTGVLEVTVTGRRVDGYRWVPARISSGIPRPLSGADRRAALLSWNGLRACTGLRG
jgi:poly-gamma-glutamate synthesis protein (capsule biosynthesis protein)